MNQAKNIIENFRVIRILLEADKLVINRVQAFVGFRQKLAEKIVHESKPSHNRDPRRRVTLIEVKPLSPQSV
jgi:hypothetical protein